MVAVVCLNGLGDLFDVELQGLILKLLDHPAGDDGAQVATTIAGWALAKGCSHLGKLLSLVQTHKQHLDRLEGFFLSSCDFLLLACVKRLRNILMLDQNMAALDGYLEVNELHLELERGVRRDHRWVSPRPVGVVGWTDEHRLLTLLELAHAFVPSTDNLADADLELEWLVPLHGGVEDCAVFQGSMVVRRNQRTLWHHRPSTLIQLGYLERHLRTRVHLTRASRWRAAAAHRLLHWCWFWFRAPSWCAAIVTAVIVASTLRTTLVLLVSSFLLGSLLCLCLLTTLTGIHLTKF